MFYTIVRTILKFITILLYRPKVIGIEKVPSTGRIIVCSNHYNFWDPILIASIIPRKVHFMAKAELFEKPVLSWALPKVGAFPVKRGQADRKAIKWAIELLENDKVLGIFPEGTRSKTGELQKGEPGISFIAVKGKSPIIPIGISGSYKLFKPLVVNVGEPMTIEQSPERKLSSEELQDFSDRIMELIALLQQK